MLSRALLRLHIRMGRRLFYRLHRETGSRLRVLASGGRALEPDLACESWKRLAGLAGTGYGLTETSMPAADARQAGSGAYRERRTSNSGRRGSS